MFAETSWCFCTNPRTVCLQALLRFRSSINSSKNFVLRYVQCLCSEFWSVCNLSHLLLVRNDSSSFCYTTLSGKLHYKDRKRNQVKRLPHEIFQSWQLCIQVTGFKGRPHPSANRLLYVQYVAISSKRAAARQKLVHEDCKGENIHLKGEEWTIHNKSNSNITATN